MENQQQQNKPTPIDRNRPPSNPEYIRLSEAAAEFGGVAKLARLMKKDVATLYNYKHEQMFGRKMLDAIAKVGVNPRWVAYGEEPKLLFSVEVEADSVETDAPSVQFSAPSAQNAHLFKPAQAKSTPVLLPFMLFPVHAGAPSYAENDIAHYVDVMKHYLGDVFICQVKGESMTGAGIIEGMQLVVDTSREPKNNDIVIAEIRGSVTVKKLKKNGESWLLMPDANKLGEFEDIPVTEETRVIGVVRKAEILFT